MEESNKQKPHVVCALTESITLYPCMIGRYSDDEILLLGCHYGARVMFS